MKNLLTFLLLFATITNLFAEISVKSFRKLENDLDARVNAPIKDFNGDVSAIIKIVTTQTGFTFDCGQAGIVKTINKPSEIWVYVPYGVKRISIMHPQLGQLRDWIFTQPIEKATVYELVLTTGKVITSVEEEITSQWLLIKTEPAKAMIYLNDQFMKTGEYQAKLKSGSYTYRVEMPLYHTEAGKIEITDVKKELTVNLKPAFGIASITTSPESGATILVDGKEQSELTPCLSEALGSGEHTLQVIKEMYQPISQKITIVDGQTMPLNFVLQPNFAEITINTPTNAQVIINTQQKGTGTWNGRLNPGIYTLEVRLDKHRTVKQDVELYIGDKKTFDLQPTPIYGSLDIMTTPSGANIIINGNSYGTTPNTINKLLIGNYEVQLIKNGFTTVNKNITISESMSSEMNEILDKAKVDIANKNIPKTMKDGISFSSSPTKAYILLNGDIIGITPFETNVLKDGEYTLEIHCENIERVYKKIIIDKSVCQSYFIDLNSKQSDFVCDENEPEEIGKYKKVTISTIPSGAYLLVDGNFINTTPCTVKLKEGSHKVELRRVNYNSIYRVVTVDSKEIQTFKILL